MRKRVDENQQDIVKALKRIGAEVTSLTKMGGGVADLLVSFRQRWILIEVKNPQKPKSDQAQTPAQKDWIAKQHAPVYVVFTPMEAVNFLKDIRP